jgi:hypothetical protein
VSDLDRRRRRGRARGVAARVPVEGEVPSVEGVGEGVEEPSCEFYADALAGQNRLHRSAKIYLRLRITPSRTLVVGAFPTAITSLFCPLSRASSFAASVHRVVI